MATKQQIRKYINNVRSCNRIEAFQDPENPNVIWWHFISRKGNFIGFALASDCGAEKLESYIKSRIKFATSPLKVSLDVGDPATYSVRKFHLQNYLRYGAIVRKNGKWTWIK